MRTRKEIEEETKRLIRENRSFERATMALLASIAETLLDIRDLLTKPKKIGIPEHEHVWKDVSYGVGGINNETICDICGMSEY